MKKIIAYCLDWHLAQSDAFKDLISAPLLGKATVEFRGWDGENLELPTDKNTPLVFCMLPPTEKILKRANRRLFWVPMWDQAQGYDDAWWNSLPKSLRVITFSDQPHKRAVTAGLETLNLRYYKNPEIIARATWEQGRVLYYWNRVGMVGPDFLAKLCDALNVETLLFKPDIDPRIEENKYYELPKILGEKTKVKTIHTTRTREEFQRKISSANIVLAPRLTEGVGMVFLEALAAGACVIAHDSSTMNEYIANTKTGILFNREPAITQGLLSRLRGEQLKHEYAPFLASDQQPWKQLSKLQPEIIGNNAFKMSEQGYESWVESSAKLINFIAS